MNSIQLPHPDADRLAAFASGQVPEQVASEISQHLADCAACRTVIESLPDDTLLSLIRQRSEPAIPPEGSPAIEKRDVRNGRASLKRCPASLSRTSFSSASWRAQRSRQSGNRRRMDRRRIAGECPAALRLRRKARKETAGCNSPPSLLHVLATS